MEKRLNRERRENETFQKTKSNINRYIILDRLDKCIQWLEEKARQRQRPSKVKIFAMRGALHGYSIMIQALRDMEIEELMLDIRDIKERLETGRYVHESYSSRSKIH